MYCSIVTLVGRDDVVPVLRWTIFISFDKRISFVDRNPDISNALFTKRCFLRKRGVSGALVVVLVVILRLRLPVLLVVLSGGDGGGGKP